MDTFLVKRKKRKLKQTKRAQLRGKDQTPEWDKGDG
jgi:hypothetical protein